MPRYQLLISLIINQFINNSTVALDTEVARPLVPDLLILIMRIMDQYMMIIMDTEDLATFLFMKDMLTFLIMEDHPCIIILVVAEVFLQDPVVTEEELGW
jgi:hypothetical protein